MLQLSTLLGLSYIEAAQTQTESTALAIWLLISGISGNFLPGADNSQQLGQNGS